MDYIYIDHTGQLLDYRDALNQAAALAHARALAAEYQASFICVAEVVRYRVQIPVCDCCGQRFDGDEGEICPNCAKTN